MGRTKRTSKVLDKASERANGLKSVGTLDFGNGLSTEQFDKAIAETRARLDEYNQALSAVDEKYNKLLASETALRDLSERMLAGVAAKFGKDSDEYEQAGGVRKSERKRPVARKPATAPTA